MRYQEGLRHSERAERILGQLGRYTEAKQPLMRTIALDRAAGNSMRTGLAESLNHVAGALHGTKEVALERAERVFSFVRRRPAFRDIS